jgi:hypothetical protein
MTGYLRVAIRNLYRHSAKEFFNRITSVYERNLTTVAGDISGAAESPKVLQERKQPRGSNPNADSGNVAAKRSN